MKISDFGLTRSLELTRIRDLVARPLIGANENPGLGARPLVAADKNPRPQPEKLVTTDEKISAELCGLVGAELDVRPCF